MGGGPSQRAVAEEALSFSDFIESEFVSARQRSEEEPVHNVLFVQYDSPVSKIDPCLLQGYAMETMQ